ncbi:MAG: hypothetical protein D9C04_07680 [Nitrosopumilus sp. B06]|nr:MAG: hypothetical protein EB828_03510 [Nitrosopumilus sp. D6]RNJ78121.1 MAG: hypothetical protein D9C04_07680 [Nitrosopumilus sp. B06]
MEPESKAMLEVIERLKLARIGEYNKWRIMIKKIQDGRLLDAEEMGYYASITRIYNDPGIMGRGRTYHTRLSEEDAKPPCQSCGGESLYYCSMNDQYFCTIHVVGHDENES